MHLVCFAFLHMPLFTNNPLRLSTDSGMPEYPKFAMISHSNKIFGKSKATWSLRSSSSDSSSENRKQLSMPWENIPTLLKPIFEDAEKIYPDNPGPMALCILSEKYDAIQDKCSALQLSEQSKQTVIDLQQLAIQDREDRISKFEMDAAATEMKTRAMEASRILLEHSCRIYAKSLNPPSPGTGPSPGPPVPGLKSPKLVLNTFSDRFVHFRDNVVLDSNDLNADSASYMTDLAKCGIVADPSGVKKELSGFLHILSKPFHVLPQSLDSGAYIGGDSLTTATLALCILHLQKLGHCDLDVTVIDSLGKSKCLLSRGIVKCFPTVQALPGTP